jgi:hypothetical protein
MCKTFLKISLGYQGLLINSVSVIHHHTKHLFNIRDGLKEAFKFYFQSLVLFGTLLDWLVQAFKVQMAYCYFNLWLLNSFPTLYYSIIPSLFLLKGIPLFPQVWINVTLLSIFLIKFILDQISFYFIKQSPVIRGRNPTLCFF